MSITIHLCLRTKWKISFTYSIFKGKNKKKLTNKKKYKLDRFKETGC